MPALIDALLALETISGDTGLTIGLVVTLVASIGGLVASAIVSRERHGSAIRTLTDDNSKRDTRVEALEARLRALEEWRLVSDAVDDAVKSGTSTARGTRPYTR